MTRPLKLTEKQVKSIQKVYHQQKGRRGIATTLARQYGVTRPTIYKALEVSPGSVKKPSEKGPLTRANAKANIGSGTPVPEDGLAAVRRDLLGHLTYCQVDGCWGRHSGFGKCDAHYGTP